MIPASDAFVFFGATGDLAYKKIFPALQALIRRGELDMPIIGVARSGWTLEQLRERARDSLEHNGGVDADAFAKLSLAAALHRRRLQRSGHLRAPAPGAGRRATRRCTTSRFRRACSPPSCTGSATAGCADGARVVVEKPFGRDLASAQALNSTPARGVPGAVGLPHRPLPGQGGRAEPAVFPLRQRLPRAGLEPQLRRQRADHHGRGLRRAGSRQFLRGASARSATWSRTTCCRSSHCWRWMRPIGDDAGAIHAEKLRLFRAMRPLRSRRTWCAGSSAAIATRPAWRRIRRSKPSPRCGWRSTPGAGPACRSTSAPASACR